MKKRRKTYVISSKSRFIAFMSVALLFVFLAGGIVFAGNISVTSESGSPRSYEEILVDSGDSLWAIAKEAQDRYLSDDYKDIRVLVHEIARINDIAGNEHIHPGQMIFLPKFDV